MAKNWLQKIHRELLDYLLGSGKPTEQLTLTGISFGKEPGNLITVNGNPINAQNVTWNDTEIKFNLPEKQPNGDPWTTIGSIINGRVSENNMPFTIEH